MKKILSVLMALAMIGTMAIPAFAEEGEKVGIKGPFFETVYFVIPNVIETTIFQCGEPRNLEPQIIRKQIGFDQFVDEVQPYNDSVGNFLYIKDPDINEWTFGSTPDNIPVYTVPINTSINVGGMCVAEAEKLLLKDGKLILSKNADWGKLVEDKVVKLPEDDGGVVFFTDDSYVKFLQEGFYTFSVKPFTPMETDRGTAVIYVSKDGKTPKPTRTTIPGAPATPTAPPTTPTEVAPAPVVPIGTTNYTVKAGDTFGKLSLNYYGSMNYHNELYTANAEAMKKSGGKLFVGQALVLPTSIGKDIAMIAPAYANEGETLYTVKSGDTLGLIAQAAYGKMARYKEIFERNSDRIAKANMIYEGQIIVLPAK